jgi:hypothetical protein
MIGYTLAKLYKKYEKITKMFILGIFMIEMALRLFRTYVCFKGHQDIILHIRDYIHDTPISYMCIEFINAPFYSLLHKENEK